MAINPVPTQVVLPAAPDRNTQQGNTFSNAARTWSFALPDWGDWLNSVGSNVYNNAQEAEGFATTASAQAVAAANSANSASGSATLSQQWANEAEDMIVSGGEYSSYHYSKKSEAFKDSAEAAAVAAQAGAGIPTAGNEGDVLTLGAGNTVSFQPASGGGNVKIVASGDIDEGAIVSLMPDGTVKQSTPISFDSDPEFIISGFTIAGGGTCFLSDTRLIATVYSATTTTNHALLYDISSATPVLLDSLDIGSGIFQVPQLNVIDSNSCLYSGYDSGDSSKAKAVVIDASLDSLSISNIVDVNSVQADAISSCVLSSNNFIVTYRNSGGDDYGYVAHLSYSGGVLSKESETTFTTNTPTKSSVVALTDTKFAIVYYDSVLANGRSVIATLISDVIGFPAGTGVSFTSQGNPITAVGLNDSTFAIFYKSASTTLSCLTGYAPNYNISYSSPSIVYANVGSMEYKACKIGDVECAVIFDDATNGYAYIKTTINYQGSVSISNASIAFTSSDINTVKGFGSLPESGDLSILHNLTASGSTARLTNGVITGDTTSLYFGLNSQSVLYGDEAEISKLGDVNEYQSGLTVNGRYYLDTATGLLTDTDTGFEIGKAVSTTKLIVTTSGG